MGDIVYKRFVVIGMVAVIILNLAAWLIPGVCDWYTLHVTPIWVNTYGRFSDLFPFSLGEIMVVLALVLLVIAVVMGILLIFFRKRAGFKKAAVRYYKILSCIAVVVCIIMSLNCTMLYHCSRIDANPNVDYREYTIEELETLRNYVVEQCNAYSLLVDRDNNGYVIYSGDMQAEAKKALNNISDIYPKLKGYYPDVKKLQFSNLMSQAYIAGYYFPFSMEANCNGNMYITNYPDVYCHELSHLHGYIYEDEANFIAYLACINSDDVLFKYCGYLSVLNYVDNAYYESIDCDNERYFRQAEISENVYVDDTFLLQETWEEVQETAVFSTDTIDAASNTFTEVSLQLNGVKEGMASYDAVVDLLLQYYDGELY